MIQNALKPQKSVKTRGRKRKTTYQEDKFIIREAKIDPFISSNTIKNNLRLIAASRTIRGRLEETKLLGRTPRNVPFLK